MKTKIIAEAGTNHNGDLKLAYKLVDIAFNSGADYVKFQIIDPDSLYVPYYWHNGIKVENIVHKRRLSEKLTFDEWRKVKCYADNIGIEFTASIFDVQGVDFLIELGVPFIKLASSDLNNIELITYISTKDVKLVISTGMASIDEIQQTIDVFLENGKHCNLVILHCVSVYPCELKNTNLKMIDVLKSSFNFPIGFSDHTLDSKAACVAVSKGVKFVEKHFTLDKSLDGFDHLYASGPIEFKEYVSNIRSIEKSLIGNESKLSSDENITKVRARRGLYFKTSVKKGDVINEENLIELRPANSLTPADKSKLIGMTAAENINEFESIKIINKKIFKDLNSAWIQANNYWVKEMKEKNMLTDKDGK